MLRFRDKAQSAVHRAVNALPADMRKDAERLLRYAAETRDAPRGHLIEQFMRTVRRIYEADDAADQREKLLHAGALALIIAGKLEQ
jgi:hypothetical protein